MRFLSLFTGSARKAGALLLAAGLTFSAPLSALAQEQEPAVDPEPHGGLYETTADESGADLGDAEEHGEHGADGHGGAVTLDDVFASTEFWGSVVNFFLLVTIIVFLAKKPMGNFLRSRRLQIEEGLAEAQRLKEEAQKKYDEYSGRLEQLDRELEQIRHEMVKAGEAERDRIVADAEAKAARLRRETEFLIEQQMKQLRVDLTREAVEAAVNAAETVLRKQTSTEDQQRLAKEYLERLSAEAARSTEGRA